MEVQQRIDGKLRAAFAPVHLELVNESGMHNVPDGSESHFRVLLVTDAFEGKSRVQRHQAVYRILAEEMNGPVHALGLQTFTAAEWSREQGTLDSPPCLGGDKRS